MANLVKTHYDVSKFVLWADSPVDQTDGKKGKAKLIMSFRDGNPRLIVFTGAPQPNGVINFPCDHMTFLGVMELLDKVIASPNGTRFSIDSLTSVYVDNAPTADKKVVSSLIIGKSNEGVIFFLLKAEGKPNIIFPIVLSPFHKVRNAETNSDLPESDVSVILAKGISKTLTSICVSVLERYTDDEYDNGVRAIAQIKPSAQANQSNKISNELKQEFEELSF